MMYAILYKTVLHCTIQNTAPQCSAIQKNAIHCSVLYDAVQYTIGGVYRVPYLSETTPACPALRALMGAGAVRPP